MRIDPVPFAWRTHDLKTLRRDMRATGARDTDMSNSNDGEDGPREKNIATGKNGEWKMEDIPVGAAAVIRKLVEMNVNEESLYDEDAVAVSDHDSTRERHDANAPNDHEDGDARVIDSVPTGVRCPWRLSLDYNAVRQLHSSLINLIRRLNGQGFLLTLAERAHLNTITDQIIGTDSFFFFSEEFNDTSVTYLLIIL